MRGKDKVIATLNLALRSELQAINQYFLHAEMCENWGYKRIGEFIKKQSIDEMKHAEKVIERILFLDGTPNLGMGVNIKPGANVKEQLEADLALEHEAFAQYNAAVKICMEEGDNTSRELFADFLKDEEKHIDFLEAQLQIIQDTGIQNYLISQTEPEED
ncbi:MAG: bacterioferritin [Acidobacteria bacterium]|nr:bacterioferritin [Acidobacteriota bacterium]